VTLVADDKKFLIEAIEFHPSPLPLDLNDLLEDLLYGINGEFEAYILDDLREHMATWTSKDWVAAGLKPNWW
jgi:hypothetical protein